MLIYLKGHSDIISPSQNYVSTIVSRGNSLMLKKTKNENSHYLLFKYRETELAISLSWGFLFCFVCLFLAAPHGLWDLSSLTSDQTRAHGSESTES